MSKANKVNFLKCPVCESTDIQTNETNHDGKSLVESCQCGECGSKWDDLFSPTSRTITKKST